MAKTAKYVAPEVNKKTEDECPTGFAFGKHNYILLLAGVALIVLGFILMTGGGSKDPNVFNPEMYDFQRLTLAPILVLIGFGVEIVAIMRKPRD